MSRIFVRERLKVGRGEGKPRFVVSATDGLDLKIYTIHLRKTELDALAEAWCRDRLFTERRRPQRR